MEYQQEQHIDVESTAMQDVGGTQAIQRFTAVSARALPESSTDLGQAASYPAISHYPQPVIQRASQGTPKKFKTEVIGGHGRFNDKNLKTPPGRSRKKLGTFVVPANAMVVMYAPPGASLDDRVGVLIENGQVPDKSEVEMVLPSKKVENLNNWPYFFGPGMKVIDYTVSYGDGLNLQSGTHTVAKGKKGRLLSDMVEEIAVAAYPGNVKIDYACCSAGYSDSKAFSGMFKYKGAYIRLKNP